MGYTRALGGLGVLLTVLASGAAQAAAPDILPPEDAFRYDVRAGQDTLELEWRVQPGYYLYRERLGFESLTPGVALGEPSFPPGKVKEDEFFGRMEVYRGSAGIRIPYTLAGPAPERLTLQIKSQGCADVGICYPPQTWTTEVVLPAAAGTAGAAGGQGTNLLALLARDPEFGGDTREFLPPDEAFILSAEMPDPYTVRARWDIADGYYLYREKFAFGTDSSQAQLGSPQLPPGKSKYDEYFGDVEVYYHETEALIPISRASPEAGEFELQASFQGCAEDGICYPPMTRSTLVALPIASAGDAPSALASAAAAPVSEQDRLASLIRSGSLPLVLASFFGFGLLLAFTPCVFPMIPILSGIVVGQGPSLSTGRAFVLSLVYVLAMASAYTVAGVVSALAGQNLQAAFQHPGVIIAFSLIFVAFALAMFGVYELQIPAALQTRLTAISNRQKGGTLLGIGVMGVLSALIVGPCVAAPLAAALIVIGQTGDPVRGGLVLFVLSLGMGAPLLAFGTSAGKLLPRAGPWMDSIKTAFGLMMLGIAIWMLGRILPAGVTMLGWAGLAVLAGVMLGVRRPQRLWARAIGAVAIAYGALLLASAVTGGSDPLRPLEGSSLSGGSQRQHLAFKRIKSVEDLEREIEAASAAGRFVMLDFYADWCVSCKEMEKYTFTDHEVQATLHDAVLLQADVTANDALDQALLQHFGIFGPPTIAFFGPDGKEQRAYRVVGFLPADKFRGHLRRLLGDSAAELARVGADRAP